MQRTPGAVEKIKLCETLRSPQYYLMTSFLSEKIFYHGWTQMHTDWKERGTMLDTNVANYRQLYSRQFAKFASRPYPCPSVSIRG